MIEPVDLPVAPDFRTVAIVSSGTEILQGLYADENARYLAEQVTAVGLEVIVIIAAPDDPTEIERTLSHAASRADVVICTGGLGPTEDDLNRYVMAKLCQRELVEDARALDMMRARFRNRRAGEMPASNERQALVPVGCRVLYNDWGTAPGFYVPPSPAGHPFSAALIALPGPPREMQPMFQRDVLPLLAGATEGRKCTLVRTLHTFSRPESEINDRCRDLFAADPEVRLTILAKNYGVDLRLFTTAESPEAAQEKLASLEARLRERVGIADLYGSDQTTMAAAVAELLWERAATVVAAESCTGGWIAKLLTDIPGSSAYLKQSYVVYSNEAKSQLLSVPAELIEAHGAVSEEVARAMAEGARRVGGADYGIGVTGIAGPDGGSAEKPVGLTWIALSTTKHTLAHRFVFPADREQNRYLAALSALWLLRKELLGETSQV